MPTNTDETPQELRAVETLAADLATTKTALRLAAVKAVKAGHGEIRTAKAARIARMTLRKWIAQDR